jgi:ribose/xylose/arabinose/galactoside ABC-type transport system permease subunit
MDAVTERKETAGITDKSAGPVIERRTRLAAFGTAFVSKGFTMYPVIVLMFIVGAIYAPRFMTTMNLINIGAQIAVLGIVTLGLSFALLLGRLDLSLESTVGFAPMVAAMLMAKASAGGFGVELPGWAGLIITLLIAGLIGFFNGYLIVKVGVHPLITTLGMLVFLRGGVLVVSSGRSIYSPPAVYTWLGSAKMLGLPISVVALIVVAVVIGITFKYHRYGRAIYAVGGNEEAARAAGINVERVIFSAYIIASLLAGIGGIILTGRLDSVVTTQGDGLIFNCFAAAVIGGISLGGGKGTVVGAMSGVILIGVINNLLTLAQVPSFWVQASTGAIIIVAAILAAVASRRSGGVKTRT